MPPKISIVTINYEQDGYIWEAIKSVQMQTEANWQHIIIDAARTSKDAQFYDAVSNDPRYTVICEPDQGPAEGLNKGLALARGPYFGYINADDYYANPNSLSEACGILDAHQRAAAVCGAGRVVSKDGTYGYRVESDEISIRDYVLGTCVAVQQSTFLRTKALKSIGGFNVENRISWDGEVLARMALAGMPLITTTREWGAFRVYPESITGSGKHNAAAAAVQLRLFKEAYGRDPNTIDRIERVVRRTVRNLRHLNRLPSQLARRRFQKRYL